MPVLRGRFARPRSSLHALEWLPALGRARDAPMLFAEVTAILSDQG
jgi:hypothetical protein